MGRINEDIRKNANGSGYEIKRCGYGREVE